MRISLSPLQIVINSFVYLKPSILALLWTLNQLNNQHVNICAISFKMKFMQQSISSQIPSVSDVCQRNIHLLCELHTPNATFKAIQRFAVIFVTPDYGYTSSVTAMVEDLNWKTLPTSYYGRYFSTRIHHPFSHHKLYKRSQFKIILSTLRQNQCTQAQFLPSNN